MRKFLFTFSLLALCAVGVSAQGSGTSAIEVVSLEIVKEAINHGGVFTVSVGKQVRFTKGNLKYQASTNTWAFHDNQWGNIGNAAGNNTQPANRPTQSDWIDLFGFGTSGYHDPSDDANLYYQPWDWSCEYGSPKPAKNSSGYGPSTDKLAINSDLGSLVNTKNYDWGIYNFVASTGVYRVLTSAEWTYVFKTRASANRLFGFATLFGQKGIILLPDDFEWSSVSTAISAYNSANSTTWTWAPAYRDFTKNVIKSGATGTALWNALEEAGACFLPCGAYRDYKEDAVVVLDNNSAGRYWTSTVGDASVKALVLYFAKDTLVTNGDYERFRGRNVRLVQEVPTTANCNNFSGIKHPSVRGNISVAVSGEDDCHWTLTATPNTGYYFKQWRNYDGSTSTTNPIEIDITPASFTEDKREYVAEFVSGYETKIDAWTADSIYVTNNLVSLSETTADIYAGGERVSSGVTVTSVGTGFWRLSASLNSHKGKSLSIKFYSSGKLIAVADDVVPYVVSSDVTLSSLSLSSTTNVEVVKGKLTVNADATIGVLNIYPGAKVSQTSGTLTVDKIIMRGDAIAKKYPQFYVGGNVTNNNGDTIYYDYTLDYSHYYPLALPYTVPCTQIRTKYDGTPSYEVREYDGADRAYNVSGWKVYNDAALDAEMTAGKGYNIYAVPGKWASTSGRYPMVTLRFPMYADLRSGDAATKYVAVAEYGTEGVTNAANFNWNLIGNPYLCNYKSDIANLSLGYYVKNNEGEWVHMDNVTDHRYVTWSDDNFLSYTQALVSSTTLKAFYPYFVQALAAGSLSFAKASRIPSAPQRAWMDEDEPIDNTEYPYGLILSGDNISDRTGLLYSNKFSQNYETNADLVKIFGEQQPMTIYSIGADHQPRAFNALPVSDAFDIPVPLGYRNAPLGTMQIAFDNEWYDVAPFEAVWLTDHETNTTVNLLDGAYTFTNTQEASDTRFAVTVAIRLAPSVVTGVEQPADMGGQGAAVYYDMLGRRVNAASAGQGVYVVIENGTCRKEVVK